MATGTGCLDSNSEDLCGSGDYRGVGITIKIRGGSINSFVPVNKSTMKHWLKTTFVRRRKPPGPWIMTERTDSVERRTQNDYSWVDQITCSYLPSNAGGAKVLQTSDAAESVGRLCVIGHPQHHQT